MNLQLIMLPNPILVSDEKPKNIVYVNNQIYKHAIRRFTLAFGNSNVKDCKEIIAGIEGLPKLDLSDIAEEIGWVDVEKLAYQKFKMIPSFNNGLIVNSDTNYFERKGWIDGFKAAQSLNEKKFSEKDFYGLLKLIGQKGYYVECDGTVYANAFDGGDVVDVVKEYSEAISKPKEYNVEVEMEEYDHKEEWSEIGGAFETFKTRIKVTKILN